MTKTLQYLLPSDHELLASRAARRSYTRLDVLVEEEAPVEALFVVVSGGLRVERTVKGHSLAIARLLPGDVFGEMSFLEQRGASACVAAEEDSEVLVLQHDDLRSLLETVPGLNARFYQSLAAVLSKRVRETSEIAAQSHVDQMARVNRFHSSRTGHMTERQLPPGVVSAMEAWQREIWAVRTGLRERRQAPSDAAGRVVSACDQVVRLLEQFTSDAELIESALSDPLSFRGGEDIASGIGAYLFRETFSTLMTSTTLARCYMKPLGYPDDHVTMARIQEARPDGDGQLGVLVDAWFLNRPLCASRRATQEMVGRELVAAVRGKPKATVAALACGQGGELIHLLDHPDAARAQAIAVDLDEDAIVELAVRAGERGVGSRLALLQANVLRSPPNLPPQDAVSVHGMAEYLDDDRMVDFLDGLWRLLAPGGVAIVTNLAAGQGDRLFMEHILDWKTFHRTPAELMALAARSRFGQFDRIEADPSGGSILAVARREAGR